MTTLTALLCPQCGSNALSPFRENRLVCGHCGSVILTNDKQEPTSVEGWVCNACQFVNEKNTNYCGKCAERLTNVCPKCRNNVHFSIKNCTECGYQFLDGERTIYEFKIGVFKDIDAVLTNRRICFDGRRAFLTDINLENIDHLRFKGSGTVSYLNIADGKRWNFETSYHDKFQSNILPLIKKARLNYSVPGYVYDHPKKAPKGCASCILTLATLLFGFGVVFLGAFGCSDNSDAYNSNATTLLPSTETTDSSRAVGNEAELDTLTVGSDRNAQVIEEFMNISYVIVEEVEKLDRSVEVTVEVQSSTPPSKQDLIELVRFIRETKYGDYSYTTFLVYSPVENSFNFPYATIEIAMTGRQLRNSFSPTSAWDGSLYDDVLQSSFFENININELDDFWIIASAQEYSNRIFEVDITTNIIGEIKLSTYLQIKGFEPHEISAGTDFTRVPVCAGRVITLVDGTSKILPLQLDELPAGEYYIKISFHPGWESNRAIADSLNITTSIQEQVSVTIY